MRALWRCFNLTLVIIALAIGPSLFGASYFSSKTLAQPVNVPNFWDPNVIIQKPGKLTVQRFKFLTTTDFPPFNFIDRRKRLSGFHIDLAREICRELQVLKLCLIQALPWDELEGVMQSGEAEILMAGLQKDDISLEKYAFTQAYFRIPGRFVALNKSALSAPIYANLFRKKTGVVTGSAHETYMREFFENREIIGFETLQKAHDALKKGEVDAVFSDAVSQAFWLASDASEKCCQMAGGPFLSNKHFGSGLHLAVAKDRADLIGPLNYALRRINDTGKFRELYLRYFPIGLF